jgi:hypothetical protein
VVAQKKKKKKYFTNKILITQSTINGKEGLTGDYGRL